MKRPVPTNYSTTETAERYRCDGCGAHGVKLWRDYQTFADRTRLLCADCAEVDQRKSHARRGEADWKSPYSQGYGDQIGWLIPAVPTEEGDTFWGYTSVPPAGCAWWKGLPVRMPARGPLT